jgi:hypothetical protein
MLENVLSEEEVNEEEEEYNRTAQEIKSIYQVAASVFSLCTLIILFFIINYP